MHFTEYQWCAMRAIKETKLILHYNLIDWVPHANTAFN